MPPQPRPFILLRQSYNPLSNQSIRRPPTYFAGSRRHGPRYNRFDNAPRLRTLWSSKPYFRYGLGIFGGGCAVFYVANLERVPVSGRRRFNCVPTVFEQEIGKRLYQQMLQQYAGKILPPNHPDSRMVGRVMERLVPASRLEEEQWEAVVIRDDGQKNAFVLTGGKVFVFSGILPICAGEEGLAAVLGHEIAHNVAHHVGERISQAVILFPFGILLSFIFDISSDLIRMSMELAYSRPGSRKQESEADYIGLLLMAKSCYDPEAAIGFWHRMALAEKHSPPQFLSTHPSSQSRTKKMEEWLPQAKEAYAASECGQTTRYATGFKDAFETLIW